MTRPVLAVVIPVMLALAACGPARGSGTVQTDAGCYTYEYSDLTPPTATSVVPVTVSPCQPGAPAGRDVLIMGSSTTACTGPSSVDACYVTKVKNARPADRFTVIGRGGTYVGYGTAGQNWTTTPIPTGQEIVVIQLGINDWYVPVDPAQYRAQLDTLIGRIRSANPDADLYWVRAWMPNYPTDTRLSMWTRHAWVTADALAAVNGTFLDMPGDPAPYRADTTGWHYNDAGHQALADKVLDLL